MSVKFEKILINSKGFSDIIDITQKIHDIVPLDFKSGIVNIFSLNDDVALTLIDKERNHIDNIKKFLENNFESRFNYSIDDFDYNEVSVSKIKTLFFNRSLTLPIVENNFTFNNKQRILLLDFSFNTMQKELTISLVN